MRSRQRRPTDTERATRSGQDCPPLDLEPRPGGCKEPAPQSDAGADLTPVPRRCIERHFTRTTAPDHYSDAMPLSTSDLVPPFESTRDNGQPFRFEPGRWTALFFFPKTSTTHCQLQARQYQALHAEFARRGVDVIGVNGDPRREQGQFRDVCQLDYALLNDRRHVVSELFGVLGDPWPGEDVQRPRRETFLIDPGGVVRQHWVDVEPRSDAGNVLAALETLTGGVTT